MNVYRAIRNEKRKEKYISTLDHEFTYIYFSLKRKIISKQRERVALKNTTILRKRIDREREREREKEKITKQELVLVTNKLQRKKNCIVTIFIYILSIQAHFESYKFYFDIHVGWERIEKKRRHILL